jgi:hypothetical protein
MSEGSRHVQVVKRWGRQKFYAKFISDNNKVLAHTEHYVNFLDLTSMLATYYPTWEVKLPS